MKPLLRKRKLEKAKCTNQNSDTDINIETIFNLESVVE